MKNGFNWQELVNSGHLSLLRVLMVIILHNMKNLISKLDEIKQIAVETFESLKK